MLGTHRYRTCTARERSPDIAGHGPAHPPGFRNGRTRGRDRSSRNTAPSLRRKYSGCSRCSSQPSVGGR